MGNNDYNNDFGHQYGPSKSEEDSWALHNFRGSNAFKDLSQGVAQGLAIAIDECMDLAQKWHGKDIHGNIALMELLDILKAQRDKLKAV